jgi:hypothetical protein
MRSWRTDHIDGVNGSFSGDGTFYRDRHRLGGYYDFEHSLMTTGERVMKAVEKGKFRTTHHVLPDEPEEPEEEPAEGEEPAGDEEPEEPPFEPFDTGFYFTDEGTPEEGEQADIITVPYSDYKTGVFTFDEEEGVYYAEEYGRPFIDGNDGTQLSATNVLILHVTYINTRDSYGHLRINFDEGEGWYASGGKIVPITWEKKAREEPIHFFTEDGEPLFMNRGKTYINFQPKDKTPTWEAIEREEEEEETETEEEP